jgi:hypothetical protein
MEFKEYQHVVKLDDPEVEGLLVGKCYIFPKIDGTNASIWLAQEGIDSIISAGSRRRHLTLGEKDNAGFLGNVLTDSRYPEFFNKYPNLRLYGEWLVPHTMKTYRDDAWRKFYVFDVCIYDRDLADEVYVPYEDYKPMLDEFGIDYIPPLRIITDPSHEDLMRATDVNTYLIKEDSGVGEGVVIKNYEFVNKYGRIKWGKIVRNDFKDKLHKEMGAPERDNHLIEKELVDRFFDKSVVDKIYANILIENASEYGVVTFFEKKWIPRLLEQSYHDFVTEEIWGMAKYVQKQKLRGIDFKNLKQHTFNKIKEFYPQLFRRTQ